MSLAMNEPAVLALLGLEYVACCLQMIHLPPRIASTARGERTATIAYELGVLCHLLVAACFILGEGTRGDALQAQVLASPWAAYLWANAAAGCASLAHALRQRCARATAEALLMGLCTPPAMRTLGPAWTLVAFIDVSFFFARCAWMLYADHVRRTKSPTTLSIAETINVIPVGLLATDGRGRSLAMNNAMRTLLERLGCPTDLGDLSGLWGLLGAHAHTPRQAATAADKNAPANQLVVPDTFGGVARVTHASSPDGRVFYLAEGITEQYLANQRLEQANAELKEAAETLRARLADVGAIAEGDAYLRMRQRVHDVVGQRLSILHRYLEEGRVDDASVAELTALLASIPHDLRGQGADAQALLEAVVKAFSLVDVKVCVAGELPRDPQVAGAFARVIREAATNACRHGHARTVSVSLGTRASGDGTRMATLFVTDDGTGAASGAPPRENGGIAGMRRALAGVGGTLSIASTQPFTLCAEAPSSPAPRTNKPTKETS